MRRLAYTSVTDPTSDQLAAFKGYIGQSGNAADLYLTALLKEAMVKVGEAADVSLLSATCILSVSDWQSDVVLYGNVSTITSVKSGDTDIEYTYIADSKVLIPASKVDAMRITYTTTADASGRHLPSAWEYAKARYDGADAERLGEILNRI